MLSKQFKKELLKTPRGTRDLLESDLVIFDEIKKRAEELARYYGYHKIQTPAFEHADLFLAALGDTTDMVEKQMYTFRSRGGDHLVLRPEKTVPTMRAYFEHGMQSEPQPVMVYSVGSCFRHESPQKGRFREFTQFDLDILGEDLAVADATTIRMFNLIFKEIKIDATLELNTIGDKECRPIYRKELVAYYRKHFNQLCKDCKRRYKENPLRLLDCKEPTCAELKQKAPQMIEYLCDECKKHFKSVLEFMDTLEISYRLNPYLVRGLDYYSRTVFEFIVTIPPENEKEPARRLEVGGGGRYDYLGDVLGGRHVPAVGGAFGVDRVAEVLRQSADLEEYKGQPPRVFLIQLGDAAKKKSLYLMEEFRKAKIPLSQSLSKDSIRGQLRIASKVGADFSLIIGQKEAMDGTVIIRDMDSGMQESLPFAKVIERLHSKLKSVPFSKRMPKAEFSEEDLNQL